MKTFSCKCDEGDVAAALKKAAAIEPQITLLFAAPALFRDKAKVEEAVAQSGLQVIGCSTAGEISDGGVSDNSLSVLAMHFDGTQVKLAEAPLSATEDSYGAGKALGRALDAPDLKNIFVLGPGLNINGSKLTKGIADVVDDKVTVTGGLAGDGTDFGSTFTLLNGKVHADHVVAFALYGDKVRVTSGSRGGWKPFGPIRRVTKAENNVLFELDGKPALELYQEYLGEKAAELPASGLLYPFAIVREEDRQENGLIRTLLDIDKEAQSLVLAGELPEGSLVRLMHADTDSLVDGAREAAEETGGSAAKGDSAALLVSCVGRKLIMGGDVDEEIEAVVKAIGGNAVYAGFYSYGEICPFAETGFAELHNQTMTITHISEEDMAA